VPGPVDLTSSLKSDRQISHLLPPSKATAGTHSQLLYHSRGVPATTGDLMTLVIRDTLPHSAPGH